MEGELIKVSKKKWDSISEDYKGRWIKMPNVPESYIGKRTVMSGCISNEMGTLLTEGFHFVIIE